MAEEKRSLTAGEIELLRQAFKDRIRYDGVRLSNGHRNHPIAMVALKMPRTDAITLGSTIYFGGHYHPDFSVAPPESKLLLFHEMTHVWQWATLGKVRFLARYAKEFIGSGFNAGKMYAYRKADDPRPEHFLSTRLEAQADMIRDYGRARFAGNEEGMRSLKIHLDNTGFFDL